MKQPFGTVTGFDQTWVVQDQVRAGAREVKYTVDPLGIELLLYPDSVDQRLKAHDRAARRYSQALGALPWGWGYALVVAAARASSVRDRINLRLLEERARSRSLVRRGLVPVGSAIRPQLARAVTAYDVATEQQRQHTDVLRALRHIGVDALQAPASPGKQGNIAIRGKDTGLAVSALAASLGPSWYVVPFDASHVGARRVTARRLRHLCGTDGGFRIFQLVAGGPGLPISGVETAIDVEIWRESQPTATLSQALKNRTGVSQVEADGRLAAPRRQAFANRLTTAAWNSAAARSQADFPMGLHPHLFSVTGPIDVVYTWVDGADPAWNEQRAAALGSPQGVRFQTAATHAARFRSHDELRYSLRSLEMFAPWVRTVHIVTAGQVPYWLETAHPRLNLVDHRDIFADPTVLPVFNSHAIESSLHRIPGVAERYIYLNDDVFFGRPVSPDLFFHGNGLAKFFPSSALIDHGPRVAHDDPVTSAAKNNRALIEDVFGRTTTTIFQHTPHPQLRSVVELMEREHPEIFTQVAASKFRHPDDVSVASALHHYYAYALGKATPGRLEYLFLDLGHPRVARRLRGMLRNREFDVFCLNDSPDVSGQDRDSGRILHSFLSRYYPLASSFERDAQTPHLDDGARRLSEPGHEPSALETRAS